MQRLPDGYTDAAAIAHGGTATVYRAHDVDHDRPVAIKIINAVDDGVARRFERERRSMGRLSTTPGIAPIYSSGTTATGEPYLVMPYYEGGTLHRLVSTGPNRQPDVIEIMTTVAAALTTAHEMGVLHLDIKPSNILLDADDHPYLADFGIAEIVGQTGEMSGSLVTPSYAPPERLDGAPPDASTDIYGVGAVLYALLAGESPFGGTRYPTASAVIRGVMIDIPAFSLLAQTATPAMVDLIAECLDKDPDRRPHDAGSLHQRLVALLPDSSPTALEQAAHRAEATLPSPTDHHDVSTSPNTTPLEPATSSVDDTQSLHTRRADTPPTPLPPPDDQHDHPRRRRWAWAAAGVVALAAIAASAVVLNASRDDDPPAQTAAEAVFSESGPPPTEKVVETSGPAPDQPGGPSGRTAEINAGIANIRSEPDLSADIVAEAMAAEGTSINLLGPIESGWYEVDYNGAEGWVFAALIVPPDPGFAIAQSTTAGEVTLRDANGEPLDIENPSGAKVLITDTGDPLHQVLLPDGETAYVAATEVTIVAPDTTS